MNHRPCRLLRLLASIAVAAPVWTVMPVQAQSHRFDCETRSGIDRARCERHERMYAKCGPLKGEEHFACDREFLLVNPLDCSKLDGDDAKRCAAEVAAFRTCEPHQGRAFLRCVRDAARGNPMGH